MTDNVNHPPHYKTNGLEAIDVLSAFFADDPLGWQVGKYILRYKKKNGVEDLQKAQWYLNRLISELEKPVEFETNPIAVRLEPAPRSWDSLYVTPWAVKVKDKDGDEYQYRNERWHFLGSIEPEPIAPDEIRTWDIWGPFTEVLA